MLQSLTASRSLDSHSMILWLISAATVVLAAVSVAGGHFNVDEGVYHLMLRDYAATGGVGLWNGYEEFPSAELTWPVLVPRDGHLFSQYPQLYVILAAPLYGLLGYKALFLLNALAIVGALWLTVWLARALFPDKPIATTAGLIFVFATYAWDYANASMPHALSVLCVLAAVACTVEALNRLDHRSSLLYAGGAGLIAGFSVGIRLDGIFILPVLVVPFLFHVPWRPRHTLAVVLGVLPGLAVMAAVNQRKFGHFNPFTYGREHVGNAGSLLPYLAIAAAGTIFLAGLWIANHPRFRPLVRANWRPLTAVLAALAVASLLIPQVSALAVRLLDGVFQLVVDFRIRDLGIQEGGLSRGPGGSLVYMGGLKKSLLQSCPYLTILAIPAWCLFRRPQHRAALALLFLVPLIYCGVYGSFAWHGGLGLNLRYFVPILPFTSILAAYALHELKKDLPEDWRRLFAFSGLCLVVVYAVAVVPGRLDLSQQETLHLSFPLFLAVVVLILALLHAAGRYPRTEFVRKLLAVLLSLAIVWSGLMAFAYDLPRSYMRREIREEFAKTILPKVAPDSLFFVASAGPFFGLFDLPRVRIATPDNDDFQDFEPLARFHIAAGRPVYAWLDTRLKTNLEERGIWPRIRFRPLLENEYGQLIEIQGFRDDPDADRLSSRVTGPRCPGAA